MNFEWHLAKAEINLAKHGVSFDEASTLFDDPFQYHYRDDEHSISEQRFICIGFSIQFRLLMMVYTEPVRDTIRIISARMANAREEKDYEAQRNFT
jgi:uncharacterized protein